MGTYEFNHALIRQALYGELSTPRRVRMHQRIGEAIEAKHADRLDPHLTELAYHLLPGRPQGRPSGPTPTPAGAGDRALEAAAYEEAARYFDMVLQVVDLDDQADPAERGDILVRLLEATELAATRSGESRERLLDQAVTCARLADDPGLFTRAVITVGRRSFGGSERADTHLIGLLREAIDRVAADDHASRADLASCLTRQLFIHDLGGGRRGAATSPWRRPRPRVTPRCVPGPMHAAGVGVLPGTREPEFVATLRDARRRGRRPRGAVHGGDLAALPAPHRRVDESSSTRRWLAWPRSPGSCGRPASTAPWTSTGR